MARGGTSGHDHASTHNLEQRRPDHPEDHSRNLLDLRIRIAQRAGLPLRGMQHAIQRLYGNLPESRKNDPEVPKPWKTSQMVSSTRLGIRQ